MQKTSAKKVPLPSLFLHSAKDLSKKSSTTQPFSKHVKKVPLPNPFFHCAKKIHYVTFFVSVVKAVQQLYTTEKNPPTSHCRPGKPACCCRTCYRLARSRPGPPPRPLPLLGERDTQVLHLTTHIASNPAVPAFFHKLGRLGSRLLYVHCM